MSVRKPRSKATFDASQPSSPTHYSASQTLVLFLDWHSVFFSFAGPAVKTAAAKATELRSWAKSNSIPIAHALIDPNLPHAPFGKDPERSQGIINALKSPEDAQEPDGIRCDDGSEPMFLRAPGYVSAQRSPGLNDLLTEKGYKHLILAGVSTSGCVLRTANAATEADYVVTVVEDACADPAEGVHEVMTQEVLPMRAHVASLEEFMKAWEGSRKT